MEISSQGDTIFRKNARGQYYEESDFRKNNEKINKWNKSAIDVNQALQMKSSVSSNTVTCGGVRLDKYIGKQCFIDIFFSSLWKQGKQKKPVIAYGNASFDSTGRGEKAAPLKRIKRECQKQDRTFDVNESPNQTSGVHRVLKGLKTTISTPPHGIVHHATRGPYQIPRGSRGVC
eukprot:609822-Hanusia_phi.AAC.2